MGNLKLKQVIILLVLFLVLSCNKQNDCNTTTPTRQTEASKYFTYYSSVDSIIFLHNRSEIIKCLKQNILSKNFIQSYCDQQCSNAGACPTIYQIINYTLPFAKSDSLSVNFLSITNGSGPEFGASIHYLLNNISFDALNNERDKNYDSLVLNKILYKSAYSLCNNGYCDHELFFSNEGKILLYVQHSNNDSIEVIN